MNLGVLCSLLQLVPADRKGMALSFDSSVVGACGMIAASVGTSVYQMLGLPGVAALAGVLTLITMGFVHLRVLHC